jgi:hypothetical protein
MHILQRLEKSNGLVHRIYEDALAHIDVLELSVPAKYQNVTMRKQLQRGKVEVDFLYMASYIRQLEAIVTAEALRKNAPT